MTLVRERRTPRRRRGGAAFGAALALALLAAGATGGPRPGAPPDTAAVRDHDPRVVLATAENLQAAFTHELHARERYVAWAARADAEGYGAVARLMRACARAESIHARRMVQAIAHTGQNARAVLDHVPVGTTAENLRAALEFETYEAGTWYPALIERARAEGHAMAVRSLTLALATERGHARLLARALERLEERPLAGVYHVCPFCGRTVEELGFRKCPGCFTPASRFLRPA